MNTKWNLFASKESLLEKEYFFKRELNLIKSMREKCELEEMLRDSSGTKITLVNKPEQGMVLLPAARRKSA